MRSSEKWRVCEECGQAEEQTEIIYLPEKEQDYPWVICRACFDAVEDSVDELLAKGRAT